MNGKLALGGSLAAAAILGGVLLYGHAQQAASAAVDYSTWEPSAAAIRQKIGTANAPAAGMTEKQRCEQFCSLFKNRFRNHDPQIAIGARFLQPNRLKLMCPARLEPFLVDRIAVTAWREATADFGRQVDVDIFATFIGTNQIKIGELRAEPDSPKIARVAFDFSQIERLNRPHKELPIGTSNSLLPPHSPPLQPAVIEQHGH